MLDDFDPSSFWEKSVYADASYVGETITHKNVMATEQSLGYKLPAAYINMMRFQNGGIPKRSNHRTESRTSWAKDHIAITGIFSIGNTKVYSLCGPHGSQFWIDKWGYPAIGVYFADCPSAGHDMLCLDYSQCGREGEPRVVHVDQDFDYQITVVATNFEAFIRGLESDEVFSVD